MSRRRFRLSPPKVPTPNVPQVDPGLWIVHYGPADPGDRIPAAHIPFDPRVGNALNYRNHLKQAGQIPRKEFMLSDRVNWPQIPLARDARGQPAFAGPGHARPMPQQMAYPPHPGVGVGPPSKRPRHAPGVPAPQQMMGAMPPMENAYDDDEDTSRGDLFDNLTPREISMSRYKQNHEWMEEVLSSAYRIGQISHADLGLGLQGELRPITNGIFEAQGGNAITEVPTKPYIGHLDAGLADDFRKRVAQTLESTNVEIAKMKAEHAEMLAKFKANSVLMRAEVELRSAGDDASGTLQLEKRQEDGEDAPPSWGAKQAKKVEDIVANVEKSTGRKPVVVPDVSRIQDGGYQEPAPVQIPDPIAAAAEAQAEAAAVAAAASMSRQHSNTGSHGSGMGADDIDMGGTAAGLLDQMQTGHSSTSTPLNSFPTPQPHMSAMASSVATPAHISALSPQGAPAAIPEEGAGDVAMEDVTAATAPDQGTGSGDWVVVPKGGMSPGAVEGTAANQAPATDGAGAGDAKVASKVASAVGTPAMGDSESMAFDGDHNDFSSLGDLDTAAEALEGYDPPTMGGTPADLDDGLDLGMDVEDSAFKEAFHGVNQAREEGGQTPLDGDS
jgi:hypothetical protein